MQRGGKGRRGGQEKSEGRGGGMVVRSLRQTRVKTLSNGFSIELLSSPPPQPHPFFPQQTHPLSPPNALRAVCDGDNWVLWLTRQLCFLNWHKFQYVALPTTEGTSPETQLRLSWNRSVMRNERANECTRIARPDSTQFTIHIFTFTILGLPNNSQSTIHNPSSCDLSLAVRARLSVSAINCAINFNYCYFAGTHREWQLECGYVLKAI